MTTPPRGDEPVNDNGATDADQPRQPLAPTQFTPQQRSRIDQFKARLRAKRRGDGNQ